MHNTSFLSLAEAIKIQSGKAIEYPVRYYATPTKKKVLKLSPAKKSGFAAPHADGGIVSNTQDLIKWNEALHNGKVLSKKSYKQMINPYFKVQDTRTGYTSYAGYGTFISKLHSGTTYYHYSSAALGIRCDAGYIPKEKIAVAILSNVMIKASASDNIDWRKPENQIDISYLRDALLESL
jgi:CubicO group peptidase (beta-lactamase class C family)